MVFPWFSHDHELRMEANFPHLSEKSFPYHLGLSGSGRQAHQLATGPGIPMDKFRWSFRGRAWELSNNPCGLKMNKLSLWIDAVEDDLHQWDWIEWWPRSFHGSLMFLSYGIWSSLWWIKAWRNLKNPMTHQLFIIAGWISGKPMLL